MIRDQAALCTLTGTSRLACKLIYILLWRPLNLTRPQIIFIARPTLLYTGPSSNCLLPGRRRPATGGQMKGNVTTPTRYQQQQPVRSPPLSSLVPTRRQPERRMLTRAIISVRRQDAKIRYTKRLDECKQKADGVQKQ